MTSDQHTHTPCTIAPLHYHTNVLYILTMVNFKPSQPIIPRADYYDLITIRLDSQHLHLYSVFRTYLGGRRPLPGVLYKREAWNLTISSHFNHIFLGPICLVRISSHSSAKYYKYVLFIMHVLYSWCDLRFSNIILSIPLSNVWNAISWLDLICYILLPSSDIIRGENRGKIRTNCWLITQQALEWQQAGAELGQAVVKTNSSPYLISSCAYFSSW